MPASGTEAPATSTGGHRITWGDFHNIDLGSTPRISDLVGLGSIITFSSSFYLMLKLVVWGIQLEKQCFRGYNDLGKLAIHNHLP